MDDRRRLRSIKKSWRCNHAETNPEKQCYLTLGQCVPLPGAPMEDAPQRCMSRNAQTCTADDDNCMWNWNVKVDVLSSSTDIPLARVSYYSDVKEYKKMRIVQALVAAANSLGGTVGRFLRRSFSGVFSQTIQEAIRYKGHGVAPDSRTFSLPLFNFMGIFDNMFYSRVREYEETARKNVEELMFNSSTEAEMVGKDIVTLLGNNPGIVIDTEIAVRHVRQRLLRSLVYIYSRLISQTKSMMVNDGTDEDKSLLTPLELEDLMNINADCDLLVDIEEEEEAIANLDFETDDISLADDQLIGSMANRRPSTKMHQIALEAVKDGMVGGVKAVPGALHGLLDHTEWGISNIPLVGEHAGRAIKPMVDTVRKNVLPERAGEKKKGRDIVEGTWSDVDSVGGKKDEVSGRSTMKQLPHPFSKAFASKTNPFAKALNGKHTPHALKLADFKARHQARADSGDGDSVLSDLTQDDAPATMQGRGRSDSDSDSEGANDEDWRSVSSESSGLTELTFLELNTTMEKREKRVVASATSTGDDSDNSAGDESGLYDSEDLSVQTPESRQDANTLRSTRTALSSRSSADQTSSAVGQSISSKAINDFRTDAVTRAKTKGLLNFLLPDDDESDKEDTSSVGDEPIASASRRTTAQGVDGSETGKVMSGDMNGDGMSNYLNFPRDTKIHADKITIRQMDYDMSATYRVEIDIIFLSENMNYDLNDKTLAKEVRLKMEEAALSTTSDQKYLLMGDVFKVRPAQCSNGLVFEKEHCRKIITGITPTMVNGHSTLVIDEGVDFLYPLTILDALLVPYRIARSFMFRVAVYKEPSIIRGAIRSEFLHAASFPMLHMYDTDEDNQDDVMDMGSLRMNKQYKYERLGNFLKVSRYLLVFTEEIVVQSVLRFDYQFKEAKQKNVAKINNVLGENDYRTGVIPAMSGFPFLKPVFPYLHLSDINMQFNTFDLKISIESGPPLCASARELDEDISPFDTAENVAADIREEQERHGKKGTVSPIQILQGVKKKKKANRKLGSDAIFSADGSSSSEEGVEDLFSDERSETASACPNPDDAKRHQVVVSLTDLSIDLYIRLHITKGDRVLYSARACHVVVTSDFFSFFLQPDYSSDSKDEVLISYHVQHTPFKYKWRSAPWYVWNIKKTQTFLESNLDIGIKNLILKFLLRQVFPTAPGVRKSNTRVLAGPSVLLMKVLIATDEKIDSLKAEGKDVAASQQDAHASITLSTYDLPLRNDQTHELPMLLANLNQILLLSGISLGSDAIVPKDSEFKTNPAELEDGAELSGDMGEGGVSTMFDVWDQLG